jgi:uncharacterized protein YciI
LAVYHIAVTTADAYLARREPHRHAHIERLRGLRAAGLLVGGGPAPDGTSVDLFCRLQHPEQARDIVEEDPYWSGGAWTGYVRRSFAQFVEPWEMPPVVLDGSRRVTIVEGPTGDLSMAEFALIEMRGAGRIAFGGFFEDGGSLALARTRDGEQARAWFAESGFWRVDALTARPFLHVL